LDYAVFLAQFMKNAFTQLPKMFHYFACKANRRNSLPQQVCVVHKTLPRKTADLIPTQVQLVNFAHGAGCFNGVTLTA
jgi:hypothetical protein